MKRRAFLANGIAVAATSWIHSKIGLSESTEKHNSDGHKRIITLTAKPNPIELDLNKTVVLVVDMQNDFCSKGGLLDLQGVDLSIAQRAIVPTHTVLSTARKVGLKIVYLKMAFKPDLSDLGLVGSPNWFACRDAGKTATAPNGSVSRFQPELASSS